MNDTTKYVGLDVSKESIVVAVAEEGREEARSIGVFTNTSQGVRKLVKKLGPKEKLQVCYEAGPTGYWLYRLLMAMGVSCEVIAPSLIPQKPGERVKTDRRDAMKLARLYRAGELTSVSVPTEDDEALRDLIRARECAKEDEVRAKHRLIKFLLRHNINPPADVNRWTMKYWDWLGKLRFDRKATEITFQEYLHTIQVIQQRLQRIEKEIKNQSDTCSHAALIRALQSLRGFKVLTSTGVVAEVHSLLRFRTPEQLMAYSGLVPSESSSGLKRRQGRMGQTGNRHLRRLLIEAAWSYRHRPSIKGDLKKRLEGQSATIQEISWTAQKRLHEKYYRLLSRGKVSTKALAAIARELLGFVWAIGQEVERTNIVK